MKPTSRQNGKAGKVSAHGRGLRAERGAEILLRLKGYRIIARRYKTKFGEIDIIARRGDTIVFVEVKYRATLAAALSCLSAQNQERIIQAARHYLATHPQ